MRANSSTRPLSREDLPEVAGLYELVMRSGSPTPPPGLRDYFEWTFFDHPWVDAEIPSLVHRDDEGRVTGFLGSHVRRMCFDGESARLACSGQLVVEPRARRLAVGALLLRQYLAGSQDLTITDGATHAVRRMWESLGGETAHLSSLGWTCMFRPWRSAADFVARRTGRAGPPPASERALSALDRLTLASGVLPPRLAEASPLVATELGPQQLIDGPEALGSSVRLRPVYDTEFLSWLFKAVADVTALGVVVARVVRTPRGQVKGWYVYYLLEEGGSQVLQIAARERDVQDVFDDLLRHARDHGAASLHGRLEPRLVAAASRRRCLIRPSENQLIHSRTPEILHAIQSGQALLTRLEGEWWMGHHIMPFEEVPRRG